MASRSTRTIVRRTCELLGALLFGLPVLLYLQAAQGLVWGDFCSMGAVVLAAVVGGIVGFLLGAFLLPDRSAELMTTGSSSSNVQSRQRGASISLDQLIALNDELAALSRVGVPLERGLIQISDDMPGRLGRITEEMGRRLEAGESLAHIVSETDGRFPPLYRAVVEAGIRGGNLTAALDGLSSTVRRVAELRKLVGFSLIYPLAIIGLAYMMFVITISYTTPGLLSLHGELELSGNWWLERLVMLGQSSGKWWPWPPVIGAVVLLAVWLWSGRSGGDHGLWGRLPTFGRVMRAGRVASFAEVFKLLVEQAVPLDEAIVLAASASGDASLQRASDEMARQIRGGRQADTPVLGFPPLLHWMIANSSGSEQLGAALGQMARRYHARAQRLSQWMTVYLPMVLAAGLGGTATLLLALITLGPWLQILYQLGQP